MPGRGRRLLPRPQRGLHGKVEVKGKRLRVHDIGPGAPGDPAGFEITVSLQISNKQPSLTGVAPWLSVSL